MNTKTTENNELIDFINSLGIEYTAKFVPASRRPSRTQGINWDITLKHGSQSLTTEYWQGIGHIPGYKQLFGKVSLNESSQQKTRINQAIEHGKLVKRFFSSSEGKFTKESSKPTIDEILYCLVSDADAINYTDFEDWANSYGYDTDSREAEKTYQACLKVGLQLRGLINDNNLQLLREHFQDY